MTRRLGLRRAAAGVAVIVVTALVAPAATAPGFNAADLLVVAAPFVFLAAVWPREA